MRDLGCFCRARLRLQQARGLTWVPCVGSTQGLPQTPDLLGVRFVISSDSAEPVPAEIPALCGPSCIVLCCSFGAVGEAPEDRTAAQVSGRTIDLPPKGKCILISLRVSLAAAGCGQELVFQQRQEDVQLL